MPHHRIQQLPIQLANQIAAGEVIERPASIVKELIENSIDAGATQIKIDIEGAGSQLIRITDNGVGIHSDDLPLALSRHATSKIQSSDQLSHIASLGFRGEALPSISAVSHMIIRSRQADTDHGWQINGTTLSTEPATHPIGTTIEVRDLFFNLPARRRFLRSEKTEQSHILTTLQRLALSRFDIGFHYTLPNQTRTLPIIAQDEPHADRIAKICGAAFLKKACYLDQQFDEMHLTGWLSHPDAHRAQTDIQYFFINGRIIRARIINHAIRQAFAEHIPAGRHPAYVLYFTLPLDRVDINVHPTKHEVRFRDSRRIHGLITRALQDALTLPNHTPSTQANNIAESSQNYHAHAATTPENTQATIFGHIITLLHQRYALSQADNTLWLIDIQQADLNLRQQQLSHALKTNTLRSRPILVPIPIDASPEHIALTERHADYLQTLNITLQKNTANSLILRSIPSLLAQADLKQLIHDILIALQTHTPATPTLEVVLTSHLPSRSFDQIASAQQVLQQYKSRPKSAQWCRKLETEQLNSLLLANRS